MTTEQKAQEIDTRLADLHEQAARVQTQISSATDRLYRMAGYRQVNEFGRRPYWKRTIGEMLQDIGILISQGDKYIPMYGMSPSEARASYDQLHADLAPIMLEIGELDKIYAAGPWQRFFPCLNRDGHIHASLRGCPTVRWDTAMGWRPDLSAKPVANAVAKLGEALCTVCFPSAPSDWKAKTLGQVADERTKGERDAAKAERQAKKDAKNLAEDEIIVVREHRTYRERITTVAAAKNAIRKEIEFRDYFGSGRHPSHEAWAQAAEQAKAVLLAREARHEGWGATQEQINKIIDSAVKRNRAEGARI